MNDLHLIRMSIDAQKLYTFAQRSRVLSRDIDDGYAIHALFSALFDHGASPEMRIAPRSFMINNANQKNMVVLAYTCKSAEQLCERMENFADPLTQGICNTKDIVSKPMPIIFPVGKRLEFEVRACPTRRIQRIQNGKTKSVEIDAFLAQASRNGCDSGIKREMVYKEWLKEELNRANATTLESTYMKRFILSKLMRRTQGKERIPKRINRPDVTFGGVIVVSNNEAFINLLKRGVGRHRAFGFGMLLIKQVTND